MGSLISPIFGSEQDGAVLTWSGTNTNTPPSSAFTGTAGASTGSATNTSFAGFPIGFACVIHQTSGTGAGQWERNYVISYSPGTVTLAIPLTNTYTTGAQILILRQYSAMVFNSGSTIDVQAYNGTIGGIMAFCINGPLLVYGTINGVGKGFRGGTGGVNSVVGAQGESTTGLGGGSSSANNTGGGGGTNLGSNGSGASTTVGTTDLSTMLMGGGGGGSNVPSGQTAVNGGGGGGIVLLWARTIDITGAINVNGQAGQSGYRASGAGAGGSCLIFAERFIHLGSNLVTALGGSATSSSNGDGTGGGGSHATSGTSGSSSGGGTGGNGRIALAKCSVDDAGTTNPTYFDQGYQSYCGIVGRD